jgi:hypothetical protein
VHNADSPVRHYCTLFDRNYLLRGLALHRSLERHAGKFVLHVLCMDDTVHELLGRMALPGMRLIRRVDFEDPELLAVKPTRTVAEYCWTCTPSLSLYALKRNPEVELITYLDADLFFFSSPEPIFAEFGGASTLIVEHRFAPRFAHFTVNGKYNVEWLTFRRDANAMAALRWWRAKCIEWCFYRLEEDRMGDQKYLDRWPMQFEGVHVLQHVGAGVAPWNFTNYRIWTENGTPMVDNLPLIFYHFHGFRYQSDGRYVAMTPMYLHDAVLPRTIYDRYNEAIEDALAFVRRFDPEFSFGIEPASDVAMPGEAVAKAYWRVPEWCRVAARRIVPRAIRGRLIRALGGRDDR